MTKKYILIGSGLGIAIFFLLLGVFLQTERQIFISSNSVLQNPPQLASVNPPQVYKITCFTQHECQTPICQSGQIKLGEVALNPKHGKNKIVIIDGETYYAKWISDDKTDIDIYFEDYQDCLSFGVQYLEVKIL